MHIQVERAGATLVVRIKGEMDLNSIEAFREAVDRELTAGKAKNLILVLSDVTFIDSSGVGAILGRYKAVSSRGGKMVAVGLRPMARRILEMSGALRLIQTADSERRALARL